MADVFINDHGNGYTTSDALPPLVEGEVVTLTFYPDPGEELEDVRAFDSHDYSVALPPVVGNQMSITFRSAWNNLYVDVYYSGSTPPPTPTLNMWLVAVIAKIKRKRRKY